MSKWKKNTTYVLSSNGSVMEKITTTIYNDADSYDSNMKKAKIWGIIALAIPAIRIVLYAVGII
ncbi:hypothetical protein J6A31_07405 [bacterium]|nr:hypothetical protein [bacterium]